MSTIISHDSYEPPTKKGDDDHSLDGSNNNNNNNDTVVVEKKTNGNPLEDTSDLLNNNNNIEDNNNDGGNEAPEKQYNKVAHKSKATRFNKPVLKLTSNSNTYNIKDFSPDFRFITLIELAETLGKTILSDPSQKEKVWSKVEYILQLCPTLPKPSTQSHQTNGNATNGGTNANNKFKKVAKPNLYDLDSISDDEGTEYTEYTQITSKEVYVLAEEKQEAALAVGHFLLVSKGAFQDKIIPILVSLLNNLSKLKWHHIARVTPDFFAYNLVSIMREISKEIPTTKDEICSAMAHNCLERFNHIMNQHKDKFLNYSKNSARIVFGIFKALSEGLPEFNGKQIQSIISVTDTFLELASDASKAEAKLQQPQPDSRQQAVFIARLLKTMMILVLKIFRNIVELKEDTSEQSSKFYNSIIRNFSPEFFNRVITSSNIASNNVKIFIHSIDLAVSCATNNKTIIQKLLQTFNTLLQTPVNIKNQVEEKIEEKMYTAVINALQRLCVIDLSIFPTANKMIREFAEMYATKRNQFQNIDIWLESLASIYEMEYRKHKIDNISGLVSQIAISIFTSGSLGSNDVEDMKNIVRISLLSKLAKALNNNALTEQILSVILGQFSKKKNEGDVDKLRYVIDGLVCIPFQENTFKDVSEAIFSIYHNCLNSSDTTLGQTLTDALYKITDNLTDPKLKYQLLIQTCTLFNRIATDISVEVQKVKNRDKVRTMSKYIGIFLPVIAKQIKTIELNIKNPSSNLVAIFREFWFNCVLFGFVDQNRMGNISEASDWNEACRQIAKFTPLLAATTADFKTEVEQQYDNLSKSSIIDINEMHTMLGGILSKTTSMATIKKFNFARTAYMLCVYHLESLRVQSGSLDSLARYLEDSTLLDAEYSEVYHQLGLVINCVFNLWMVCVESTEPDQIVEKVESQTIILLKQYCNRYLSVRLSTMNQISKITKKFTHVFWSVNCLETLLNLLDSVYKTNDLGETTEIIKVKLTYTGEEFILPENFSDRQDMLSSYTKLTMDWLTSGLTFAPVVVQNSIQECLLKYQSSFNGALEHLGYSLANYISTPSEHIKITSQNALIKDNRNNSSILGENRFYVLPQALAVKSFHLGEVNSLTELTKVNGKNVVQIFVENLSACLADYKKNGSNMDMKKYNHYMQAATSFLIQEKKSTTVQLMQYIIWIPVYIFSRESLKTAIFCWKWLCSSRPDLELALLTEMYHSWIWTRTQKIGLFQSKQEEVIELAKDGTNHEQQQDSYPHRLWINYLAERYQVIRPRGMKFIDAIVKFVFKALENPENLSKDGNSLGSRFRLCLLGNIIAKDLNDPNASTILRGKVYAASLNWFSHHPIWYDPKSKIQVKEDINVLRECIKRFSRDKAQLKKSSGSVVHKRPQFTSGEETEIQTRFRSDTASVISFNAKLQSEYTHISSGDSSNAFPERASKQITLINHLIAHEIERTLIWENPHIVDVSNIAPVPGAEEDVLIAQRRSMPRSTWQLLIKTAWDFSPRLALQLPIRFPIELIREELRKLVLDNASSVQHIPEAVIYLITPANVKNNVRELKLLLNWAPGSLVNALTFLNAPYVKNALVEQYAIRILRSFPPNIIVFYLPQIVQCLRHDSRGTLKRQLLLFCSSSSMFAHQLLWTLRTEIINEKEMTAEEISKLTPGNQQMSEIGSDMYASILAIFTEKQKQLFDEEFGFFDQITKISDKLIPVEKPNRNAKFQEYLKDVNATKNLYVPFDNRLRIVGLKKEKSITLKSAKKVPILIPFLAKQRKLDENEETLEEEEEEDTEKVEEQETKLIFKAGDDCRQDQLALQIIAMFKRIFERNRLPLYLYPYRVLTTRQGEGIIECVPETQSRHNLGEKFDGSLYDYFMRQYGHVESVKYQETRRNFIESMAAYSIASYILNIKDRHNGNILIDNVGHVIHIDFGFIFDIQPGGHFGIEQMAPFKLTNEMLMIMGEKTPSNSNQQSKKFSGQHAEPYLLFEKLAIRGFLAMRDHAQDIISICEVMLQSELPCFKPGSIANLKSRLSFDKPERDAVLDIKNTIYSSYNNLFTRFYDEYQYRVEGVQA